MERLKLMEDVVIFFAVFWSTTFKNPVLAPFFSAPNRPTDAANGAATPTTSRPLHFPMPKPSTSATPNKAGQKTKAEPKNKG